MLQATIVDCKLFDPFPFLQNGLTSPDVDIRRGEMVQALMQWSKVVIVNEGVDLLLHLAR